MNTRKPYKRPEVTTAGAPEVTAAWQTLVSASRQILAAEASGNQTEVNDAAKALRVASWNYTDVCDAAMAAVNAPGYVRRWVRK